MEFGQTVLNYLYLIGFSLGLSFFLAFIAEYFSVKNYRRRRKSPADEGRMAAMGGIPIEANPYHGEKRQEWEIGWKGYKAESDAYYNRPR